MAAAAVVVVALAIRLGDAAAAAGGAHRDADALTTPRRPRSAALVMDTRGAYAQDWPVPPSGGAGPRPGRDQLVRRRRHPVRIPIEGTWEPLEFVDPTGDVSSGEAARDGSTSGSAACPLGIVTSFGLASLDDVPLPMPDPAEPWIAYGVVLDTNGDGAPDVRIGIDNMATGEHRAWRTDLSDRS